MSYSRTQHTTSVEAGTNHASISSRALYHRVTVLHISHEKEKEKIKIARKVSNVYISEMLDKHQCQMNGVFTVCKNGFILRGGSLKLGNHTRPTHLIRQSCVKILETLNKQNYW